MANCHHCSQNDAVVGNSDEQSLSSRITFLFLKLIGSFTISDELINLVT